jgi:adenylate kinase
MNIFVAGVHGVGKTYLASRLPPQFDVMSTSASKLIKEELATANWDSGKRVADVDGNQVALARSVKRHNSEGRRLLIDGHFVLLNSRGEWVRLEASVFRALDLSGVVLIEADPMVIAARIGERDGREMDIEQVRQFVVAERTQGQLVCQELGLPLIVMSAPSVADFVDTIVALSVAR